LREAYSSIILPLSSVYFEVRISTSYSSEAMLVFDYSVVFSATERVEFNSAIVSAVIFNSSSKVSFMAIDFLISSARVLLISSIFSW